MGWGRGSDKVRGPYEERLKDISGRGGSVKAQTTPPRQLRCLQRQGSAPLRKRSLRTDQRQKGEEVDMG